MLFIVPMRAPPTVAPGVPSGEHKNQSYYKLWSDKYKILNTDSPSNFARTTRFLSQMGPGGDGRENIMCNRPIDYGTVPLALLCPIFGQFEDDFQTTPESDLNPNIFHATRELANEMAGLYSKEADRQRHFQEWLRRTYDVSLYVKIGKYKSDGHYFHPEDGEDGTRFLILITEAKLESSSTEARIQGLMYYRAFYQNLTASDLQGRGCLPAILLTYLGMFLCCGQDV